MQAMERSVSIRTPDGYTLAGIAVDAEGASKLAILCHGINSDKQEYLSMFPKLAARLAESHVSSIRFDFRGHGESSGKSQDFDVVGQLIDLSTVVRWSDTQYKGGFLSKAFVGVSFGAPPGIFLSATGTPFSSISLVAPVLSYSRTFLNPETKWAKASFNECGFEQVLKVGYLLLDGKFRVSARLLEEMKLLHPETVVRTIKPPVLLIHGSGDGMVPFQVSEEIGHKTPNIEIRILKDMDHGLFIVGDDEGRSQRSIDLEDKVLGFIVEHIRQY